MGNIKYEDAKPIPSDDIDDSFQYMRQNFRGLAAPAGGYVWAQIHSGVSIGIDLCRAWSGTSLVVADWSSGSTAPNMGLSGNWELNPIPSNQYNRILVCMDNVGAVTRIQGTPAAALADVKIPSMPNADYLPLALVNVQDDGSGTSGSINGVTQTDIIQMQGLFSFPSRMDEVTASGVTLDGVCLRDGVIKTAASATTTTLAASSVTTTKIADGAVNAAKIATGAVGNSEIAANAVDSSEIAADAVGQSELKETTANATQSGTGTSNQAMTGGLYCLYPQTRVTSGGDGTVEIATNISNSSFVTQIGLTQANGGEDTYAQWYYVTASGEIGWLWVLRDSISKVWRAFQVAPDHVCMGSGPWGIGDPSVIEHPFTDYWKDPSQLVTDGLEIVVSTFTPGKLANITREAIRQGKDRLEIIRADYEFVESGPEKQWPTTPVTVGIERDQFGNKTGVPAKRTIPKPTMVIHRPLRLK